MKYQEPEQVSGPLRCRLPLLGVVFIADLHFHLRNGQFRCHALIFRAPVILVPSGLWLKRETYANYMVYYKTDHNKHSEETVEI